MDRELKVLKGFRLYKSSENDKKYFYKLVNKFE